MEYLPLLMLAPLSRLVVSDFRHREVSVMWLAILAVGTLFIPLLQCGWIEVVERCGHNLMLISYMGAGILLWTWIKTKKIINPVNLYIGLGDLLFFLILIPLFPIKQYAYLLIACMVFSLLWWWTAQLLRKNCPKNIPLIATSGIVVGGVILLEVFLI